MRQGKLLLVYPQPAEEKNCRFGFSLNLMYLAAILQNAHHDVRFLDYAAEPFQEDAFVAQAGASDIVILEFDAFPLKRTLNLTHGETLIRLVRDRCPRARIIVFGYDCILNPRNVPFADYTITSEAESSIEAFVGRLLDGEGPEPMGDAEGPLADLDLLPFPARNLLSAWAETGGTAHRPPHLAKSTLIQTSRGCRNSCRFCQRQGWSRQFRAHSVDYSLREFQEIHELGYMNVWVTDDNFCFNLPRSKELLLRISREVKRRPWKLALSTWSNIDKETIDLCRDAGVSIISLGIESAHAAIRDFYHKQIDLDHVADIINYADSVGVYCVGNFIIGAPMETEATIIESETFAKSVPFDQINVKILDYMIGSPLFESLPAAQREGQRHLFACQENGLCDMPLPFLRERARAFTQTVAEARRRPLQKKLQAHGPPYFTLPGPEEGASY